MKFPDHIQRNTNSGRTPLDEWSARRRDLYLTTHNRQTSMPPVGFEPTISAGERPQTYALNRAATTTGLLFVNNGLLVKSTPPRPFLFIYVLHKCVPQASLKLKILQNKGLRVNTSRIPQEKLEHKHWRKEHWDDWRRAERHKLH